MLQEETEKYQQKKYIVKYEDLFTRKDLSLDLFCTYLNNIFKRFNIPADFLKVFILITLISEL